MAVKVITKGWMPYYIVFIPNQLHKKQTYTERISIFYIKKPSYDWTVIFWE